MFVHSLFHPDKEGSERSLRNWAKRALYASAKIKFKDLEERKKYIKKGLQKIRKLSKKRRKK